MFKKQVILYRKLLLLLFLQFGITNLIWSQKISVGVSNSNVFYICEDSTISAMGNNYYGQLGDGTTIKRTFPVKVKGLNNVIAVDGVGHMALRADSTLWQWARWETYSLQKLPIDSVIHMSSGFSNPSVYTAEFELYYVALKADGTVWIWGDSDEIQTGYWAYRDTIKKVDISDVIKVEAGTGCVVALKEDGSVWTWGSKTVNGNGYDSSDYYYSYIPQQVNSLENIIDIAAGGHRCYALKDDGTVWQWGYASDTMLYSPFKFNLQNIKSIYNELWMFGAIEDDGSLYVHDNSDPYHFGELDKVVPHMNAQHFASSGWNTVVSYFVLAEDNSFWRWGNNNNGQLGNFTYYSIEEPELMPKPCLAVDCDTITDIADTLVLDTTVYPGVNISLQASLSEADLYWWYPRGNVSGGVFEQEATVNISDDTEFSAVIMDTYGCMRKERFLLRKLCPPELRQTHDTVSYIGARIDLIADIGRNYSWNPITDLTCFLCRTARAEINDTITYTVSYIDSNNCTATEKFKISFPDCDTILNSTDTLLLDTLIIPGIYINLNASDAISYNWESTEGLNCYDCQSPTARIYENTEFTVSLKDIYNCQWTERFRIVNDCDTSTHSNPIIKLDTLCYPGVPLDLIASESVSYSWMPEIGLSCDDCNNPEVIVSDSIRYTVSLVDSFSCVSKEQFIIRIKDCDTSTHSNPIIKLDTLCYPGIRLDLIASESVSYSWIPETGLSCDDCNNPEVIVSDSIRYTVNIVDRFNCVSKEQFIIHVRDCDTIVSNNIEIKLDTVIHYQTEIPLEASESYSDYIWSPTDGLSCFDCQKPKLQADKTAEYIVEITDEWRCPIMERFLIERINLEIIIPNVFTPNSDGINDYFEVQGLIPGSVLKVYNSVGQLVYGSDDYLNDWNGGSLNEGTYWYSLEIPNSGIFQGWIYLKR